MTRFFQYLITEHAELSPTWLSQVLDDQAFYQQRRLDYHDLDQLDEGEWEERFQEWCRELEEDLDLRGLWLPRDLGGGMEWAAVMGWREATLQQEANRVWQGERERLMQEGFDIDNIREQLTLDFRVWLDTEQDRLDGMTPREVIVTEREERNVEEQELP